MQASDRTLKPLKVRWKKHRSVRALVRTFVLEPAKDLKLKPEKVLIGEMTFDDFVKAIEALGMWAFANTRKAPPEIHYWHKPDVALPDLAHMLGHELGHLSGTPFKGVLREELRAEEFGDVARILVSYLRLSRRT